MNTDEEREKAGLSEKVWDAEEVKDRLREMMMVRKARRVRSETQV